MQSKASKTFILHVGDAKTGTTSIQRAMQLNTIQSAAGAVDAYTTPSGGANAIAVARAFREGSVEDGIQSAREVSAWLQASDARYSVLSSEYFSRANAQRLHQTFSVELSGFVQDMRVIAYVRPHASRLLSAFVQRLKTRGSVHSLDKFAKTIHRSDIFTYAPRFTRWADLYGARFALRPFVRNELVGGDVVEDFFNQVFDGTPFSQTTVIRENTTLTERTLAGLSIVHKILNKEGVGDSQRGKLARLIYDYLPEPTNKDRKAPALSRAAVELVYKYCAEDAKAVDDRFFHKNILAKELEKAMEAALPEEPDLSPAAHLKYTEITAVKRLTKALLAEAVGTGVDLRDEVGDEDADDDGTENLLMPNRTALPQAAVDIARILAG